MTVSILLRPCREVSKADIGSDLLVVSLLFAVAQVTGNVLRMCTS